MKFKNPKTGETYTVLKRGMSASFCRKIPSCQVCPIGQVKGFGMCANWVHSHPELAASLMGYEVIREGEDAGATPISTENPTRAIAIDFDGTLFKTRWPEILEPNREVIDRALEEKRNGAQLILWTCREGKLLEDALAACKREGLHFDAVNDSTEDWKRIWGTSPRKVGATEYWDDRAVNTKDWRSSTVTKPASADTTRAASSEEHNGEAGPDPSSRRGILLQATRCVCGDRDQDYGSPENSLSAIASLWADYIKAKYGVSAPLTGVDASAMMVLFKIARVATGHGKADNWVDAAGYAACGGEIEARKC